MINHYTLNWTWQTGGSGWVELGLGQVRLIGLRVKTVQVNRASGRVELTCIFHMNFFFLKRKHVFAIWKVMQQIT